MVSQRNDIDAGAGPVQADVSVFRPLGALGYRERLRVLHEVKLDHTRTKRRTQGARDADDQGMVPLPPEVSETVEAVSGSGVKVRDVVLKGYRPESNHPSGGFFGARLAGRNFRRLLEVHPVYIHPANSMAGAYMVNFNSYRKPGWPPECACPELREAQRTYALDTGIGGLQHFCPDLQIGLEVGWGGLFEKVRTCRTRHPAAAAFYDGLEEVVLGMQGWIRRHAEAAAERAGAEEHPELRQNLEGMAETCAWIAAQPPRTFREACQWLVFFQAGAKMYNGSGEWGQLDELLRPYYERDSRDGRLSDEEAIFHIACLLLSETAYIQLGGPNPDGSDRCGPVSFLILEAVHRLRVPANVAVRVGPGLSDALFRRGLEILFEDRMGFPKFVGDRSVTEGYRRATGCAIETARSRVYAGCHWLALPGREYGMMDLIKVDFAWILRLSLDEMMQDETASPATGELWRRFEAHLDRAVATVAAGIDVHLEHMHEVFPELYLDLFCHGPVEKGLDASAGGVEFLTIGVDGASLATAADSFAALEQRLDIEGRLTWPGMYALLASDWAGPQGEAARRMMRNIPRFGSGDSAADAWARRIARTFAERVTAQPTPRRGARMIPGLFSWAKVIPFGKRLGATPNGRKAGEPVSHGPNPEPGFNAGRPGTPTQMVRAVAAVQPGYGNTAPLQLDLDPGIGESSDGLAKVEALLRTHFDLGGTLANINVLDRKALEAAAKAPERHPDLIVRVTGFSAYFASLSEEMRRYVLDRVLPQA
ncbi:MAG: formate acetyltransferase [Lentisphaeria bacterium]|nr:formate acetyltransferase [Lentisphaeria bacterium]